MATLKTISAALKLIDTKKENLKKAYDELQARSSLLSSFSLSWSDIDYHFTSIQNSLTQRFHSLESLESQQSDTQLERTHQSYSSLDLPLAQNPGDRSLSSLQQIQRPKEPSSSKPPSQEKFPQFPSNPSSSSNPLSQNGTNLVTKNFVESDSVVPRHELSALCERMDGKGLRKYVIEHFRDSNAIQDELLVALRCAPDPAAMVLDSLDEFHGENGMKDSELRKIRRSCLLLLEQLRVISPKIEFNVREKAKKLAAEWKGMLMTDGANTLGALGYLHFVVAYGLVSEVSMDELVDFSAMAANSKEVPELCRIIGLTDKVSDLVQKLIDKGKHVLAVKYVCEFNLADKIPPGPILKACVNESQKLAKRIVQEGKPPAEAIAREIHALKSLIKVIESHKLESVYPLASLEQRIEQLNKQKADRKRPVAASTVKPQPQLQQHQQQQQRHQLQQHQQQQQRHQQQKKKKQKQQQQGGNKRPRTSAPIAPAAVQMNVGSANSALHQYQQPLVQPTGLLQEHPNPYMSSQALPYGMVGPTPTISSYTGPSAGPYGFASVPMGSSGNPSQVGSHLYSTEPNVPSGYYDRIATYGGHPHHYHTSYYPQ